MIFLIEYDRSEGRIVQLRTFEDDDGERAEGLRLEVELALNRSGVEREVVILQAASVEALHHTHRRYFESPAHIYEATVEHVEHSGKPTRAE